MNMQRKFNNSHMSAVSAHVQCSTNTSLQDFIYAMVVCNKLPRFFFH